MVGDVSYEGRPPQRPSWTIFRCGTMTSGIPRGRDLENVPTPESVEETPTHAPTLRGSRFRFRDSDRLNGTATKKNGSLSTFGRAACRRTNVIKVAAVYARI